ncbi:MAG TPA: Holliday junction resolvase RuvX [Gammaproteobacteria bacterium]|jgi:putative Holliday junction resolvase|nr:Holliday junction resolvase RuvX [Gammaproteobacteria bacterium]
MVKQESTPHILLGFDFGMKRIGVAVGQTVTKTARPLTTLAAKKGQPDWVALKKIIDTWRPEGLVVGIPLNMDGSSQPLTELAHHFSTQLTAHFGLAIYEIDERLTTKDARERLFQAGGYQALQGGQVDAVAAQLILQNWLDRVPAA